MTEFRNSSTKALNMSTTLPEFVTSIGDRWARGLDPTSTGETYRYALKLWGCPRSGHLPVTQITVEIIHRTIDETRRNREASRGR